ncbi:hypothetical protein [Magnetospirillum sp. UT-4]|uniref:hypothetical protein n=1 Tax=Magnetospirillum sp. UT-4 TaxID=2681467 RepID=UPI00137F9737|nr:hypothetical protein [Magnetospirillum sp. UT-4]CAA7613211.1 hypothetical protein MTBUT4_130021 [Magnetospirillum sp. UT-4]
MLASPHPVTDIEIATRLLAAGRRSEAYGLAVAVLHRVGDQGSDEARRYWTRASELAEAAWAGDLRPV